MAASDFIQAVHHLKISKEFFQDIQRETGVGTKGYAVSKKYIDRIDWIYNDFLCNPMFDESFRKGLKEEWLSDAFTPLAIMEKIATLTPTQRDNLESAVDLILKGEEITFVLKP